MPKGLLTYGSPVNRKPKGAVSLFFFFVVFASRRSCRQYASPEMHTGSSNSAGSAVSATDYAVKAGAGFAVCGKGRKVDIWQ